MIGNDSEAVKTLTNQVVKTFYMGKLKMLAIGLTTVGLVAVVGIGLADGGQGPAAPKANPPDADGRSTGSASTPRPVKVQAVDSSRILGIKLERALDSKAGVDKLMNRSAITKSETEFVQFDLRLIVAEIES